MFQYNQIFVANLVIQKSAFLGGDTFNFGKKKFPGFILIGHTLFKCQNPGTPNLAKYNTGVSF